MGACYSTSAAAAAEGVPFKARHGQGAREGGERGEACPTVFELERIIGRKRSVASRLNVNLVNIEFRRGLFEVYRKGWDGGLTDGVGIGGGDGGVKTARGAESRRTTTKSGEGGGTFVATHKLTGKAYAVREVALPASRSAREVSELWNGLHAQAALDHPNVCRLQEIFCSEERYYIVTDLCSGGDPMARLAAQGRSSYEEHEAAEMVRKIAGGLSHCHFEGIVHGDLRMESCLFEDSSHWADIKIVDAGHHPQRHQLFCNSGSCGSSGGSVGETGRSGGSHRTTRLSSSADLSESTSSSGRRKKVGWYLPPEVRSGGARTEAGDMWMLGALAWLLLAGPLSQPGVMSLESARASIMMGKPPFKGRGWATRSPEAVDFVSRLLQKDARRRMTANEALEHPWLKPNPNAAASSSAAVAGPRAEGQLPLSVRDALHAFKESCVVRRLGLRLVGRISEAASLFQAKEAFRLLDPSVRGYITEDALARGLRGTAHSSISRSCVSKNAVISSAGQTPAPNLTATTSSATAAEADNVASHTSGMEVSADTVAVFEADAAAGGAHDGARELFAAMDPEGSGRVGFSAFLAACLAGKPADEAGARVAFSWLDRRRKGAINSEDLKLLTGEVISDQELENAINEAHDALDLIMGGSFAGPIGGAVRELEARDAAASGAADGFTYAEFYRLLASTPQLPSPRGTTKSVGGSSSSSSNAGSVSGVPATAPASEVPSSPSRSPGWRGSALQE